LGDETVEPPEKFPILRPLSFGLLLLTQHLVLPVLWLC